MDRRLVILDIDGTLVGTALFRCPLTEDDKQNADFCIQYSDNENYLYQKRPGLNEFLERLFENFRVCVWSDNPRSHILKLVSHIFGSFASRVERIYDENDCIEVSTGLFSVDRVKPVDKVVKDTGSKCVLIDDKDVTVEYNPGKAIKIPTFRFEEEERLEDDHLKTVFEKILVF